MELITQVEWARRNGFSKQYAHQMVKSGKVPLYNGKINPDEANKILAAFRTPARPLKRNGKGEYDDHDLSTLLLKTRIKNEVERGKLLEAKAKAELGKLVNSEEVKAAAFNQARVVRDALLNIPDRVASLLASVEDPVKVHNILTKEIRQVLEELSHA